MTTIFEVQAHDISELSDLRLTQLLKLLLHLEAKSSGIAQYGVGVALNIRKRSINPTLSAGCHLG
jgi:hypothetical protein